MIKIFRIKGDSLFPLYKEGELVVALSSKFCNLNIDNIVVFTQKDYGLMIKKIKNIDFITNPKRYYLVGTTAYSIDSRNFGSIIENDIKYKILFKLF